MNLLCFPASTREIISRLILLRKRITAPALLWVYSCCRLHRSFAQHASASLHPALRALQLRASAMLRIVSVREFRSFEPRLASLGQLRNSRDPALPLASLVCSARFRFAASRTAGASAPRLYNASHCLGTGFGILGRMNKFRVSIGYPEFVHGAKGIRTPSRCARSGSQ